MSCSTVSRELFMFFMHVLFLSSRTFSLHGWGFDRASVDRDSVVFTTTPSQPDLKDIYILGVFKPILLPKKEKKKRTQQIEIFVLKKHGKF